MRSPANSCRTTIFWRRATHSHSVQVLRAVHVPGCAPKCATARARVRAGVCNIVSFSMRGLSLSPHPLPGHTMLLPRGTMSAVWSFAVLRPRFACPLSGRLPSSGRALRVHPRPKPPPRRAPACRRRSLGHGAAPPAGQPASRRRGLCPPVSSLRTGRGLPVRHLECVRSRDDTV